jgi:hypothetical protein
LCHWSDHEPTKRPSDYPVRKQIEYLVIGKHEAEVESGRRIVIEFPARLIEVNALQKGYDLGNVSMAM